MNEMPSPESTPNQHPAGQEAIWEHYQNEAIESFQGAEPRLRYLSERLRPATRVLNVGVGSGLLETMLSQGGVDIHSLDPDPRAIQRLKETLGLASKAQVGYCENIPFASEYFDAVVVTEILEHLSDTALPASLSEVSRVLKHGGRILGTVPARERLEDQTVICPHCRHRFHRWGHFQTFNVEKLRAALEKHFTSIHLSQRLFVHWKGLNWKGQLIATMKLFLICLGIHGSNESLVFTATKP